MVKSDKKVLYMNDFPKFRIIGGAVVVAFYIFVQLWNYWLSPLTVYSKQYFEPSLYYLFPIITASIFYIAFLILTFIPYDKSWRYMLLSYSILAVFEVFEQFIYFYYDYKLYTSLDIDFDLWDNFISRLGIIVVFSFIAFTFLLPFFRRRFSKYLAVIIMGLIVFYGIINLFDVIKDCFDFYFSETYDGFTYYYYYGFLMEGEDIDNYLVLRVINSIPILPIYFFFLSLFIGVKKREKVTASPINNMARAYNAPVYYPQNSQTVSVPPVTNIPVNIPASPVDEPTVSVAQSSYCSSFSAYVEPTVSCQSIGEEISDIVPLAPSYAGDIRNPIDGCTTTVSPQIIQQDPPQESYSFNSQPRFCNQCGYKMSEGFAFCPKCGKRFK